MRDWYFRILDEDQRQILLKDKEFDFSFAFGTLGRFRVNAFHERGNLAAALRLIPNEIKSASELGMPPVVNTFADFPRGLVLVTGPTGSGKSTTLAALVDKINSERSQHIITMKTLSSLLTSRKNQWLFSVKFIMIHIHSRPHFKCTSSGPRCCFDW